MHGSAVLSPQPDLDRHGHHSEREHIFSSAPVYWQRPHCLCKKSRRKEREPREPGKEGGGDVRGTRSRTQEVEKDEELGDNVMHSGAEPEGSRMRGEEKQAEEREGADEECWKRRRREQKRETAGFASGTRRQGKIAWARLAGRVCLCLIEEGCETETPHWLSFTGILPRRDGHRHTCSTHARTHRT